MRPLMVHRSHCLSDAVSIPYQISIDKKFAGLDEKRRWVWSHHIRACISHHIITTPDCNSPWICLDAMHHALVLLTEWQQSWWPWDRAPAPCPLSPGWPWLPGLLLGGGKKKHLCSPVLSVLLSWTVTTTKVSNFLLHYFKGYCFWHCLLIWMKVANFIFFSVTCLRLVVEVVWQTRVTEAQMGTSATTLALCKCQCWHAGNTGDAPRCVSAFGLFSQRL